MAKIKTIRLNISGKEESINVNVTSKGIFSAVIPAAISRQLHLKSKIEAGTLSEVERAIYAAFNDYKDASRKEEVLIFIQYGAKGHYNKRYLESGEEGSLFGYDSPYNLRGSYNDIDSLGFEFNVVIKETVNGNVSYYYAMQGKDMPSFSFGNEKQYEPDKWYKKGTNSIYGVDKYKKIPYSETAFQSLSNAREKIRAVSELLFKFISQDEKQIEIALTKNKLLGN